ncbi:kinase-like protein [Stipitochalara longipes BDJ]|nr:kinase-like protein [Stipitochalara longipes BDJ]
MPGIFHVEDLPVSPNELLWDGETSYDIQLQLGLGNYSSVWLAKTGSSIVHSEPSRFVAVKILNQNSSSDDGLELDFARKQIQLDSSYEETTEVTRRLLLPDSTFIFNDSNGASRQVFIFGSLYGPTVHEFTRGCPKQRMDWVAGKKCLVDTISGLAFLHRNGIGHGDLHPRNLLLIPNRPLSTWNEKQVLEYFVKKPTGIPAPRIELMHMQPLMDFHHSHGLSFDGRVVIADFGSAYEASNLERTWAPTRFVSTAPEKLLGRRPDLPGDIWSLGCTIVEVLTGKDIWHVKEPETENNSQQPDQEIFVQRVVSKIQFALGMQPENEFEFPEDKRPLLELLEELWPSEATSDERDWLEALLKRIFKYEPSERVTVREIETAKWEIM